MYIDTKNFVPASSAMNLPDAHSLDDVENTKVKGVRKVWKPLLRLISPKSAKRRNSGSCGGGTLHPNNVHLNNASSSKDGSELPAALIEDYASVIRKLPIKEDYNAAICDAPCQASAKYPTVISSASIEKTPAAPCAHCMYGRNCQHELFHPVAEPELATSEATTYDEIGSSSSSTSCQPTAGQPLAAVNELIDLPIHYIRTDDGTFFWTTAQDKVDDDLLTAWLCHSFRQLPVPVQTAEV